MTSSDYDNDEGGKDGVVFDEAELFTVDDLDVVNNNNNNNNTTTTDIEEGNNNSNKKTQADDGVGVDDYNKGSKSSNSIRESLRMVKVVRTNKDGSTKVFGGSSSSRNWNNDTTNVVVNNSNDNNNNDNEDDGTTIHDQLPNVEEYKTSVVGTSGTEKNNNNNNNTNKKRFIISTCIIGVLISFIVLIVVFMTKATEEAEINSWQNLAIAEKWTIDETMLYNSHSAQYKALKWLSSTTDTEQVNVTVSIKELSERYAVAVLYYSTNGQQWRYKAKFLSSTLHICDWYQVFPSKFEQIPVRVGAMCENPNDKYVTKIFLPSNKLIGMIPNELRLLDSLQEIDFYNNQIKGTFPEFFHDLPFLQRIRLENNQLQGQLPTWIFTDLLYLKELVLSANSFSSTIPDAISSTSTSGNTSSIIEVIKLNSNFFSGTLDPLRGLSTLQVLNVDDNAIGGSISDELFISWSSLLILDVGNNDLTGQLPSDLLTTTSLRVADFHANAFKGQFPDISRYGEQLKFLAVHDNQLTGPLDGRILQAGALQHLDVSNNLFTGLVTADLDELPDLRYLFIAMNPKLDPQPIPTAIGKLLSLEDVSFQMSNRIGTIPDSINQLINLTLFDVANNNLNGTIPEQLGSNSTSLRFLTIHNNPLLTGSIPSNMHLLTDLQTLTVFNTSITDGANEVCTTNTSEYGTRVLQQYIADCNVLLNCTCCTICCDITNKYSSTRCSQSKYFGQLDPIDDYQYVRQDYKFFNDEDLIFPKTNSKNKPNSGSSAVGSRSQNDAINKQNDITDDDLAAFDNLLD